MLQGVDVDQRARSVARRQQSLDGVAIERLSVTESRWRPQMTFAVIPQSLPV